MEGKIAAQGTFTELNARDGYINRFGLMSPPDDVAVLRDGEGEEGKSEANPLRSAPEEMVPKAMDDEARRLGDRTVYKYYFQQVGALNMMTFFSILLTWIVMLKFPGEFRVLLDVPFIFFLNS